MTFSSDHPPSVSIDGMLMDSQTTVAVLDEAKRRPKVEEITLRSVTIDTSVARAASELFSDPQRLWKKADIVHCTGQNAKIIKAMICRTKHLSFTGSVPIAHNPRYCLDEECMRAIGHALQNCKSLDVLSLRGTRLDRASLQAFAEGLSKSTSLETLQLSHCAMEIQDVPILAEALRSNRHLKALSMAHCKIGSAQPSEESANQLCQVLESLASHPRLEVLNLLGMYCTDDAMDALGELLRAPQSALWHLGLKNNGRRPEDKLNVHSIFEALSSNKTLTYLQVSGNNVDDEDMEQLAKILAGTNNTLRALSLPANKISAPGIDAFAKRLSEMRGLRFLDLQRNDFPESSKQAMIAALKDNAELERLDLDGKFDEMKSYYLGLNKGGRRLLQSGNNTPLGLWPIVLERASRLPFNRARPFAHLDILFNLVRGPAVFRSTLKRGGEEIEAQPKRKRLRT